MTPVCIICGLPIVSVYNKKHRVLGHKATLLTVLQTALRLGVPITHPATILEDSNATY